MSARFGDVFKIVVWVMLSVVLIGILFCGGCFALTIGGPEFMKAREKAKQQQQNTNTVRP